MYSSEQELPSRRSEDGLDLLKSALVLVEHKRLLMGVVLVAILLSIAGAILLPPQYTSQARVVPPSQKGSETAAALGELSALAGLSGDSSQNQSELCAGILHSREVADTIIDRFRLREALHARTQDDARTALADRTDIEVAKSGIISIDVTDTDPDRAAAIANMYVKEMNASMVRIRSANAAQHRTFFEAQSQETRKALAAAEAALRIVQERTGVVEIGAQAQQTLVEQSNLQALLTSREAEAASMSTFMTKDNARLQATRQEIATLRDHLHRLSSGGLDNSLGLQQFPEKGFAYVEAFREAKYREALYEFTLKQLENARLDEANSADTVQMVDPAVASDRRTTPKRGLIVALGTITGLLAGMIIVFVNESLHRCARDPDRGSILRNIVKELRP